MDTSRCKIPLSAAGFFLYNTGEGRGKRLLWAFDIAHNAGLPETAGRLLITAAH